MRTGDEIRTEALLAAMDAADAEAVILPASAVPDEERPLLPPFLTSAHNSISPLCFLGGQHSFCFTPFAALSLSMIDALAADTVKLLLVLGNACVQPVQFKFKIV